jgi:DNA-binding transcriptional regulator GbsR (MarR family)
MRLIETGGRTCHSLGTGRIVGQMLIYLYLEEDDSSFDGIADDLGVCKASVSIAVRKHKQLGFAR